MHHLLTYHGPYEPNAVWSYVVPACLHPYLLTYLLKAFMDREAGQHAANMHVKRASACAPAADGGPSPQRSGLGLALTLSLTLA